MKRIIIFLLAAVLALNFVACESQREKEEKASKERQKEMFGNWDKDVEKWNKSRQKPTKPMWNEQEDK
jgi:hypothetical protein